MTTDTDLEAEIQRLLAEHDRIAEQGITVQRRDHLIVLGGEVESAQRRDEICKQITAHFPDVQITCDIGITRSQAPSEVEEIS
ncbi:BON domain-containing protein [Actinoplanes bogorensis]|uniref:BON domain-containing protein n=1 Tax=Paractinoplanes bogorensis TaxID=1610840 RepID=A0ABS5Z1Z8_9ACTN|nr:BON domain-containing protein [Actinoplanes bogorensis]MBU2669541.1 BON domain-containing protein [Actinoplanes bogorensis]